MKPPTWTNNKTRLTGLVKVLCVSLLISACERSAPPDTTPRVPVETITGPGRISGVVYFDGPVRDRKVIRNQPCCPGAPPTLLDESIIVNTPAIENNNDLPRTPPTLRNVVVSLQNGPATDGKNLPPVMLDQVFCQYVPHVLGVVVGQTLAIRSSDETTHNVHIQSTVGRDRNFWMDRTGQSSTTTFSSPEVAKSVCDVHPWMSAFIFVHDNAFFSVTDDAGTFNISGIPPGRYTLVAWHEIFGRLEQSVEIKNDQPMVYTFTYAKSIK
jgi:plastocyanin